MPTTVGQHSVAAFTSPVNGTTPIDANTVRGNDNTTRVAYVNHDADPGIHVQSSTLASRPAAGTAGRKWITADAGSYKLWYDDGTRWHEVGGDSIELEVIADATLVKGDVVMVTGFNNGQNVPTVNKYDGTAPAFGIASEGIATGARGYIINTGLITDIKTDTFGAIGTVLYPAATGTFTSTKPTSGTYQVSAYVLRSNANNGVLYVEFSAPRIVETSANTANTVVLRDASGNFSAGTITAGALTSTGLVTFASLKGTGATTVTNILDEDNMASDSATALATQQSIKAYVDAKVATVDTLAEVLANGNTTGANNIIVTAGQKVTTDTIDETTSGAGVTIDSVLLKDDVVNATDIETGTISANDGTLAITVANSTGALTLNTALADSNLATISTAGKVSNSATTATSANTASAIVARDGSGDFSAGTITATLSGTATQVSQALTAGSYLTSGGTYNGSTARTFAVDATDANTASKVVARDASGNFAAGTITATLNGAAPAGSLSGNTLASGVTASSLTSVGTLTSLTVSGNLTVDTNTLFVDAANNRVGVGTATPTDTLTVGAFSGNNVLTIGAGTSGSSALYFGDGTGADRYRGAIDYSHSTDRFEFGTAATVKMYLDASGNLGLGVTPSAWSTITALQVKNATFGGASNSAYLFANAYYDGSNFKYIANAFATQYRQQDGQHIFYTAPSGTGGNNISGANAFVQTMTLDASGNLGIGVTSPQRNLVLYAASNPTFQIANSTSGTTTNDGFDIVLTGSDALIRNLENGYMSFSNNGSERARITSGGYFKASNDGTYYNSSGTFHEFRTTTNNNFALTVVSAADNGTQNVAQFITSNDQNDATHAFLECVGGAAERATIRSNGGLANYSANNVNLASDKRLKKDIAPLTSTWDKLKAIEVVNFRYKDCNEGDPALYGVIAQQVQPIVPELVVVTREAVEAKDAVLDEDGNEVEPAVEAAPEYYGIREQPMYWLAIKALQEAMARIEALEARLEALEA